MNLTPAEARKYIEQGFPTTPLESTQILAKIGRDLTMLASKRKLPSIVGFEKEIGKLNEILIRSRRPNPIILGEAGVGKTALVEKMAQVIVNDSANLHYRVACSKIVEVSYVALTGVQSNSWSEYIHNITTAFNEAKRKPIIMFIDEIHQIWAFPISFSHIKPMIERGEVRIIGATTLLEYHRFLETDTALSRRFEPVYISEPDKRRVISILRNASGKISREYGVKSDRKLHETIYDLTEFYLPNVNQPGVSLDVLETASIRQRIKAGPGGDRSILLSQGTIRDVIAERSKIPLSHIEDLSQRLPLLHRRIKLKVFGQDKAVKRVVDRILASKAQLDMRPERPDGVFLFAGPTGVGKTHFARVLAEELTGSSDNLVALDMSQFASPASVSQFIRAPQRDSDSHYGSAPVLEIIRDHPHGILLLDDIDRAHPVVWNLLLKIFDEGAIRDELGIETSFSNVTIIMTTNMGYGAERRSRPIGIRRMGQEVEEQDLKEFSEKQINETFPREFLSRIDFVIHFRPLSDSSLVRIMKKELSDYGRQIGKKIEYDPSVVDFFISFLKRDKRNARELVRSMDELIGKAILKLKISANEKERWEGAGRIRLTVTNNKVQVEL